VDAWVGLGTVLLRQDRISEGLDALRRAEELAHFRLCHPGLELRGQLLGDVVALLDVDLVDARGEARRRA